MKTPFVILTTTVLMLVPHIAWASKIIGNG